MKTHYILLVLAEDISHNVLNENLSLTLMFFFVVVVVLKYFQRNEYITDVAC